MELALGLTAAVAAGGALAHAIASPRSQLFGTTLHRDPAARGVVLTFDDGPHPDGTPAILDALRGADASATFFVIGDNARRWPGLVRRMVDEGHQVANHGDSHSHFSPCFHAGWWRREIEAADHAILDAAGVTTRFFRPPMGLRTPLTMLAARRCGKAVVTWSLRAVDGLPTTPEKILRRLAPARPGDILMLHDGVDPHTRRDPRPTVAAVPRLLAALREKGLPVTPLLAPPG